MKLNLGKALLTCGAATAALALAACGGQSAGGSGDGGGGESLVVNTSFDLVTTDPNRIYEPTGMMVGHALYETLLTFEGSDAATPVPGIATGYEFSEDSKVLTLTLDGDLGKFSDGSDITIEDAVFSLQRVKGLMGNPSYLLDGVEIEQTDDTTITLTAENPYPALPSVLAIPSMSVVNKDVVEENGGTADEGDAAEEFLNSASAGSGPYMIESVDIASQVVLTANPEYDGEAPAYDRVVLQNVTGETQALNVESGEAHIALDLSPDQVAEIDESRVNIESRDSNNVIFLFANQNPEVSEITSTPEFRQAYKLALDYDELTSLGGEAASRPGGIIPSVFDGALDASEGPQRDLDEAKRLLKEAGYNGEEVKLHYANDITVKGIALQSLAEKIQSQAKEAGINITLAPAAVATELDNYRNGTSEMGLWYWEPDFSDDSNYVSFGPGAVVGERAGWMKDDAVKQAADAAFALNDDSRAAAYQEFQRKLNENGPFVSILQPTQNVATSQSVEEIVLNPQWTIDLAATR